MKIGMSKVGVLSLLLAVSALGIAQDTTAQAEKAKLARLEKAYVSAKAAFTKQPKDAALKKKFVVATVALGTATMNSPILAPKDKYPKALRLYREALKHDPKNKEARENHDVIVHIYKQMGRPVPK